MVNWGIVRQPPSEGEKALNGIEGYPQIASITLAPSISVGVLNTLLQPPLDGLVLEVLGDNVGSRGVLKTLERGADAGIVICAISSTPNGYVRSACLEDAGVVAGLDLAPAAAITKLFVLLGNPSLPTHETRKMLRKSLRGEMSVDE